MGAGAQIILAIALSMVMGPAGLGLSSTEAAVAVSLSTTAINSAISNKGNLGAVVKDTFSGSSLKNAAIAGVTAGLIDYADDNWFSGAGEAANGGSNVPTTGPIQNPGYASNMLKPENWANTLLRSGTHALIDSGVSTAINGGSFGSNLGQALVGEGIDLGAAIGNKAIGDLTANLKAAGLDVAPALAEKLILHAALGGLIAQARGESFASGAIAGGVADGLAPLANGLLADFVSSRFDASDMSASGSQLKIGTAQIIGLIAAGVSGGNPATGSLIGGTAEKYNDLEHEKEREHLEEERERYAFLKEEGLPIPASLSEELGKPIEIASPAGLALGGARGGFYSGLADSPSVGPVKSFTAAQKAKIYQENMDRNGGVLRSDLDGQELIWPQKSMSGVTPPSNEAQIDHIIPRRPADPAVAPGTNSYSNGQVLSRDQNRQKSNK